MTVSLKKFLKFNPTHEIKQQLELPGARWASATLPASCAQWAKGTFEFQTSSPARPSGRWWTSPDLPCACACGSSKSASKVGPLSEKNMVLVRTFSERWTIVKFNESFLYIGYKRFFGTTYLSYIDFCYSVNKKPRKI